MRKITIEIELPDAPAYNNVSDEATIADYVNLKHLIWRVLPQANVIKSVCDCTSDTFCCRCHEQKGWIIKDGKFVKQTVL